MNDQATRPRRTRKYRTFVLLVVLVVGGWTAAWFYIRDQIARNIDDTMAFYDARGVVLDCPDRSLAGWPFRIELFCRNPSLTTADGITVQASALRAVGPVWDPNLIIVEFDGPLNAAQSDRSVRATWAGLRASVRSDKGELVRLSVVTDGFQAALTDPRAGDRAFAAQSGEFHALPRAASDPRFSDVAVAGTLRGATASQRGAALLPRPTDADLEAVLRRLPRGRELNPRAWAASDSVLDIARLAVSESGLTVSARGALGVEQDGRLNGAVRLVATGIETLAAAPATGSQGPSAALVSAFLFMGSATKDDAGKAGRSIDVAVDRGKVKLGAMPLGALAPLF